MQKEIKKIERSPVVVVMGHVDHGKSTLLDYIRNTNVVEGEVGGITQRVSAYEVLHTDEHNQEKKITFLDTPGHEAFSKMRERGARVADIAILVVAADDGVKTQTVEAWKAIESTGMPVIVAINKVDKPSANVEKVKIELAEKEIYLENYGGKIPFVEISAKTGAGIDTLLSLILLVTEMENLTSDDDALASGFVLEANLDPKRGLQATLVLKNGTLKTGETVVAGDSTCVVRVIENYLGKKISEAHASAPVRIFGFDKMPSVGATFKTFGDKKQALECARACQILDNKTSYPNGEQNTTNKIIPVILKADSLGALEALEKEVDLIKSDNAEFRVVMKGAGAISESDIKCIADCENAIVLGFNVKTDKSAVELAEQRGATIMSFDIIYKATDWLKEELEKRRPRVETLEIVGKAKILRTFSRTKERQILGGKITEGKLNLNSTVRILRRDFEIGQGKVVNLEKNKSKTSVVEDGEFGMMIESKSEIAVGDVIESFSIVQK